MPVMTQTRNLLATPTPNGVPTGAIAPAGKKVDIIDDKTNPAFVQIQFTDGDQLRTGWVSVFAVDPATNAIGGALDKLVFADACVQKSVIWGISAHYLMSVAQLRTNIVDDIDQNGDIGPFVLSPAEWTFYGGLQEFNLGVAAGDINNWRLQCVVFAVMIVTAQRKISGLISDQPTYSQLYLAQILGTKVASDAIKNPAQTVSGLIAAASATDFKADGVEGDRILSRYPALVGGGATASVALQRIDGALQSALDATRPFIVKLTGQTIEGPPAQTKSATIVTPAVTTAPGQFSKLLNFIAQPESGGNPNAFFGNTRNQSNPQFTAMTITEVITWQRNFVRAGHKSSAAGKYQFMPDTLTTLINHGVAMSQDKLDEPTQDKLAVALMNGRGLRQFLGKTLSAEDFGVNLAMEWASMPVPKNVIRQTKNGSVLVHAGQSYYAGDGLNQSLVPVDKFMEAIRSVLS